MAQPQSNKKLFYLLGGVVVVAAYLMLTGEPTATPKKANNVFAGGSKKSTTKDDLFTPDDYKAKFAPVNVSMRDGFQPLIVKDSAVEASETPLAPNGIPPAFAGGDGNWVYSGNAIVDGTPQALLENNSTADFVFLKPGQSWKNLVLVSVSDTQVVLRGPKNFEVTVGINDGERNAATAQPVPSANGAPMNGAIGGQPGQNGNGGNNGNTAQPQNGSNNNNGGGNNGGGNRRNRGRNRNRTTLNSTPNSGNELALTQ